MSSDVLAAIGAFASGAGAVIGGFYTIRKLRQRLQEECEQRLRLFKEGIGLGREFSQEERDRSRPGD